MHSSPLELRRLGPEDTKCRYYSLGCMRLACRWDSSRGRERMVDGPGVVVGSVASHVAVGRVAAVGGT